MSKILDTTVSGDVAQLIIEALDGSGYSAEEIVPGLIEAALTVSELTSDPEQALDEAATLLADGVEEW